MKPRSRIEARRELRLFLATALTLAVQAVNAQLDGIVLHRAADNGGCVAQGCWSYPTFPVLAGCACTNIVIYEGATGGYGRCNVIFTNVVIPPLGGAYYDSWVDYKILSNSSAIYGVDYTTGLSLSNRVTIPAASSGSPRYTSFSLQSVMTTSLVDKVISIGIVDYQMPADRVPGIQYANILIKNDTPRIGVTTTNANPFEGGSSVFRFYRTNAWSANGSNISGACVIHYTVGGTARKNIDYTAPALTNTATIPAGQMQVDVPISVIPDTLVQGTRTLLVTIGTGLYSVISGQGSQTLDLLDATSAVEVTTTNSLVPEGTQTAIIFQRTNCYIYPPSPSCTVTYTLSGASGQYTASPPLTNSVTFPAGVAAVTNVITALTNTLADGTRELTLTLAGGNDTYQIIGGQGSVTIGFLDDSPMVSAISSAPCAWGTNQPGMFCVSRTGGLSKFVTVNYAIGGSAQAGSYSSLPASVTLAPNQTTTNLTVAETASPASAQTVVLTLATNATYWLGANTQAIVTLLPQSDTSNSVAFPAGRYWRGTGNDPTYWSMVVPLDYQKGVLFSNLYGNCSNLYSGLTAWTNTTLYHYDATNALPQTNYTNRIAFNNPIVAFGSTVGGTPLYVNQDYHLGIYAGNEVESGTPLYVSAYYRSNYALAGTITLMPPYLGSSNSWNSYISNNFQVTAQGYGLTVTLSDSPSLGWGVAPGGGAYVLTQNASAQATNYYYAVQAIGYPGVQVTPLVLQTNGLPGLALLCTLGFDSRPLWRSVVIDQPHFDGNLLPPFYAGLTLGELLTNTPPVTNAVSLLASACTNVDDSPELRRHPILDQFVSDMANDPIALANYVLNDIDLTDWMDYNDTGNVAEQSINLGGVSRGALGAFLEKQGSPAEQCALLVYLLRQAGVPAAYVYPPRNGVQILDARLSRMLRFQVHGGFSETGQPYTRNTMIAVNYPWVAAYIGTNWVHIFPWMKDYSIVEGLDLYDYMPTNYSSAYGWVKDFVYGNTNLLSLAVDGDATPRVILPAYLKQTLLQNYPGVSVDDLGVQTYNRRHYYARWQDFPTPTWVTNVCTAVESLGSSSITNVNPIMTNMFDTVSVEIYSLNSPNRDIQTGDMRLVDLHNRKFYLTQSNSAPNQIQLSLVLAPFNTNITTVASFGGSDTNLTSKQVLSMTLDQFDDQLSVRFKYHRHRGMAPSYPIDPNQTFYGFSSLRSIVLERPLRKGDVAAICMNYGRVTRDMLESQATDLWQMESILAQNPLLTNSVSPDVYQGTIMYLAGMKYYAKCSDFDAFNANLHKIDYVSTWAAGLSKISPARDAFGNLAGGGVDPILPNVDMFFYEVAAVGNGTLRPDSGRTFEMEAQNFSLMKIADLSAEEHQVINSFYQQTNAVSTVRLLQLAQSSGAGIVPLTVDNYAAQGQTPFQGTNLAAWDPNLWAQVTGLLQDGATYGYVTAYITPGPMTNSAYKGMAALVLGWGEWLALITPESLNGAFGANFPSGTIAAVNTPNVALWADPDSDDFSVDLEPPSQGATLAPAQIATVNATVVDNQIANNDYVVDPVQVEQSAAIGAALGTTPQSTEAATVAQNLETCQQSGYQGAQKFLSQLGALLADPVYSVTGEFYVDEADVTLPGPMPLSLRRNYSSQNLADNQFGPGWKFSIMPYLSVAAGATNIYGADMDGAVLAYVRTTTNASVWLPTLAANPQLNNNTTAGAGGLANRLRDRLTQSVVGAVTNYTLYGADGSVRSFQVMTFNNGTNIQARPYLQQWTDNRGNFYTFQYGTNATQPDFAQVRRIQCSNGNYLGFYYDVYGHVIEAYSGDGRRLSYDFDDFGDLVTVTLPDATTRSYAYQHATQSVTNGAVVSQQPYSTHLIIEEDKPDGRALINAYDNQRRVTNQLSTAGQDLTPIRTASFIYANSFNFTNPPAAPVSGYTLIIDANNHTNRLDYTNSLITCITDPLGHTVQQTWCPDNATAPGYPRSVSRRVDKRGLVTQYQYDSNGNVTNTAVTGNLGVYNTTNSTAVTTAVYNSNSLPVQVVDPVGNSVNFVYDPTFAFLPQQVIRCGGSTPVVTNYSVYGSASSITTNGSVEITNHAFGLLLRSIRAYNSPDAATNDLFYNGEGFITSAVQYTGTGDPAIRNSLFYNERNELVQRTDAAGRAYTFTYDDMGRPTGKEVFDTAQTSPMDCEYFYYTDNGELQWIDGPCYNPDNYIFYDYDGAGRKVQEIHWRSQGNADGSGVSAIPGYGLYGTTFYQYDPLGNLTEVVDPLGNYVVQGFDAIGETIQQVYYASNGVAMATNGLAYEPGGLLAFETNALAGVTKRTYTMTGKPLAINYPDGSVEVWTYDLAGRVTSQTARYGCGQWLTTYDDVNLCVTNAFFGFTGPTWYATNAIQFDRRHNVVQRVDDAGNVFTNSFDGLDRPKVQAGPVIETVNLQWDLVTYVTNIDQQLRTYIYDNCGKTLLVSNVLGETTVTTRDPLGRPIQVACYNSNNPTPVRVISASYSPDHNSVSVTNGTGSTAVATTTYTDTAGRPVLSLHYPTNGTVEYTWQQYDVNGNRLAQQQRSITGGMVTTWETNGWTYDAMNRVLTETTKDGSVTTYSRDPMGDITGRAMPGGLTWSATYNGAGQILSEQESGGGLTARNYAYQYYPNTNPGGASAWYGMPWVISWNAGAISQTNVYDDLGRLASLATTSTTQPEKCSLTTCQYDPRGQATNITQAFNNSSTGQATAVVRGLDAYGCVVSEQTVVGTNTVSSISQGWNGAGRRTGLYLYDGMNYGFIYQADGSMVASDGSVFTYADNGLLSSRTNASRAYSIDQRDSAGRVLHTTTSVLGQTQLTETLGWRNDGRLNSYTAARADFTDARTFTYSPLANRLTQESFYVGQGQAITNTYTTDSGQTGGLGLLTGRAASGSSSATWGINTLDGLSRAASEQNSLISRSAWGLVTGAGEVSATLDGRPLNVQFDGPKGAGQWRADMDLAPGSHTLLVSAVDPSGIYSGYATNTFTSTTNSGDAIQDAYDIDGNVIRRVWVNSMGKTNRTQALTWDAFNRLINLTDRDAQANGFDWTAVYDAIGRRLQTTYTIVLTNVEVQNLNSSNAASVVQSWYDPQVEFLEVGVMVNGTFSMKTYGPDASGVYGGMQGVGGMERVTIDGHMTATGTIQDYFGNVLGSITDWVVSWSPARFSSYGPVPGYQPPSLSLDDDGLAQCMGYRGKRVDETGLICLGARHYDPAAGRFISADPLGHSASQDLYSFCGGDAINWFDPDGMCAMQDQLRSLYEEYNNNYIAANDAAFRSGDIDRMIRAAAGISIEDFLSDVLEGALKGGYATDAGPGAGLGQAMASFIPVYGQIGAVRDLSASFVNLGSGGWQHWGSWVSVGVNAVSVIPGVGALRGTASAERGIVTAEGTTGLRQLGGLRNTQPLTPAQIQQIYQHVDEMGLSRSDFLIHSGPSLYSDMMDKVLIGPDVLPALTSDGTVLSQLSPRAVIAHEAGHMINTAGGIAFEAGSVMDEAAASTMGSQLPGLTTAERNLLLQHAQQMGH